MLQQLEIALHPVYFDHNAVYHVVQAAALVLLFLGFRRTADSHMEPERRPMTAGSAGLSGYRWTRYASFTKNPSLTRSSRDQLKSPSVSSELP